MILVDTSIWIDHLNNSNDELIKLLNSNRVCIHPLIIGELSCGNFSNRKEILTLLQVGWLWAPTFYVHQKYMLVLTFT